MTADAGAASRSQRPGHGVRASTPLTHLAAPRTIREDSTSTHLSVVLPVKEESLVAFDDGELLVIMSEGSVDSDSAGLAEGFRIVHAVSRRVFVIESPAGTTSADLAALPGVAALSKGDVAPEIFEGLDETEALFVRAWSRRKEESKTQRRGDGMDWDAGGFEPPDPPPDLEEDDRSV